MFERGKRIVAKRRIIALFVVATAWRFGVLLIARVVVSGFIVGVMRFRIRLSLCAVRFVL